MAVAIEPPGLLFIGSLGSQERQFLSPVFARARQAGFTRFVEPAAGAFAMAQLAVGGGWKPEQIEASDIQMFSAIWGAAVVGRSLLDLGIQVLGVPELKGMEIGPHDYGKMLWVLAYLKQRAKARNDYAEEILRGLWLSREAQIAHFDACTREMRERLGGMSYESRDMFAVLREALDDPRALISLNPPTYVGGYEKFYDTGGALTWVEPEYEMFAPDTGLHELMAMAEGKPALLICYQQREPGSYVGTPIFARGLVRQSTSKSAPMLNAYLTTNRPEVIERLVGHDTVLAGVKTTLERAGYPILPGDAELTADTRIELVKLKSGQAMYYRALWSHLPGGALATCDYGVLLDGKLAGVFGYDSMNVALRGSDRLLLLYNMAPKSDRYRLVRLLKRVASTREMVDVAVSNPVHRELARAVGTTQLTRHPASQDMRGTGWELVARHKDPVFGYKLVYATPIREESLGEAFRWWLAKEQERLAPPQRLGRAARRRAREAQRDSHQS